MGNVYTVREARGKMKEVLDKAEEGVHIEIKRGDSVYTVKKVGGGVWRYGCGCRREGGINICQKHQRN